MTSNLKVFISMTSLVSGNLCKMVCSTLYVSTLIGSYTKPKIPKIRQPQSYIDVHMSPRMFFLLLSYSRNHENIINSIMYIAYNIQACTLLTYILQITNYAVYQQIFQIQTDSQTVGHLGPPATQLSLSLCYCISVESEHSVSPAAT